MLEGRIWTLSPAGAVAGVPPAVEPGILPGGMGSPPAVECASGRQDAAIYGRRDARRYALAGLLMTLREVLGAGEGPWPPSGRSCPKRSDYLFPRRFILYEYAHANLAP